MIVVPLGSIVTGAAVTILAKYTVEAGRVEVTYGVMVTNERGVFVAAYEVTVRVPTVDK